MDRQRSGILCEGSIHRSSIEGLLLYRKSENQEVKTSDKGQVRSPNHGSAETTEPADMESDVRRVSFVSKANEMFRSAAPQAPPYGMSAPYQPNIDRMKMMSTQTSTTWVPSTPAPKHIPQLAIEAPARIQPKREAELESAVKILTMKLDYTQRKIMESENNKAMLKAKLDQLIYQLSLAGYDPNLKTPRRDKRDISPLKTHNPPKVEEHKLKAERPTSGEHMKALQLAGNSKRNASWDRLMELAEEYERRLGTVQSLEELEKYVKQQLVTPVNMSVPSIMGALSRNSKLEER